MNLNNFTIKAQEAIQKAQEIASGLHHQEIENIHILKGLLNADENVVPYLLKKLDVNTSLLNRTIERILESMPKVAGGDHYLSREATASLQKAGNYLKEFNDQFISIEHILLGIISRDDATSRLLKDNGISDKNLIKAIKQLRKG